MNSVSLKGPAQTDLDSKAGGDPALNNLDYLCLRNRNSQICVTGAYCRRLN